MFLTILPGNERYGQVLSATTGGNWPYLLATQASAWARTETTDDPLQTILRRPL
jgi:hypothetical protein